MAGETLLYCLSEEGILDKEFEDALGIYLVKDVYQKLNKEIIMQVFYQKEKGIKRKISLVDHLKDTKVSG